MARRLHSSGHDPSFAGLVRPDSLKLAAGRDGPVLKMILRACSATYAAFRGIVAPQHMILVDSSDVGQLVQPMAGFGDSSGAADD
jgi:hypothetical protein